MAPQIRFTTEQRHTPVIAAMRDTELRPRILGYVAAKRGISTAAALSFIEGPLYRELGVIAGRGDNANLGQVLDHLNHPQFDGPAPAKGAENMLDTTLQALFADHRTLNRVVELVAQDSDTDYLKVVEQLHRAVDMEGAGATLRKALEWTSTRPADLEAGLVLLDRRDDAVTRTLESELGSAAHETTNPWGLVKLDSSPRPPAPGGRAGLSTDVGKMLGDPQEFERRLARARALTGDIYKNDSGREKFRAHDRDYAQAGLDLVRTLARPREIAAANAKASQVGAQLDQAMRQEMDHGKRVRALDEQIAKLGLERTTVAKEAAVPAREEQKLRLLDAESGDRPLLSTVLQSRMIDLGRQRPELGHEERRRHVLEAAEPGCPLTLDEEAEQWRQGRYYALGQEEKPEPAATEPADPSQAMNRRVLERMRLLDRPDSEYVRTAEELLGEDARGV